MPKIDVEEQLKLRFFAAVARMYAAPCGDLARCGRRVCP